MSAARKQRRQAAYVMRRMMEPLLASGEMQQDQFNRTVNHMPFWQRALLALRVLCGRLPVKPSAATAVQEIGEQVAAVQELEVADA